MTFLTSTIFCRGKENCKDTSRDNDKHSLNLAASSIAPTTFNLAVDTLKVIVERPRGKTNNVVSDQVRHKPKLICALVFAYADCWFSHAMAQLFVVYIYSRIMK